MFYAVVYFITGMWLFLRGSEITKFSLDIGVYADMISSCINTVAPLMSILLLCLSCLNLVNAGIVKRVVEGRTKTSLTITVVALLLTGVGLVYCFFKNKPTCVYFLLDLVKCLFDVVNNIVSVFDTNR